ncbi:hypothetical protein ABBQ38_015214 [Trebouxia sp. C0009 RCD-2024]
MSTDSTDRSENHVEIKSENSYNEDVETLDCFLENLESLGWDNAVNSLAAESCKELGLTTTAHVKARLQQVSLVSDRRSYSFDPKAEIPPGTFATMVVLLLPPGMSCGDNCYTVMTYHLVQPSDTPVVIKDQAWYLGQLQAVMQEHFSCGHLRAFYMFEHRYNIKDLDNIQNLQKTHQKMAQVLQAAERAGILEAHLAVVTHREYCSYEATHYGGYEEPEVHDSETHVGNWRTLDGVNPGWEAVIMDPYGQDEILQGDEWLAGLDTDRESQEEESEEEDYSRPYGQSDKVLSMTATEHVFVVMAKYKSRAGFVIWSSQDCWHFFCQQGSKAATDKLTQMLEAIWPVAASATMVAASDQPGGQVTQETEELMTEAKSLVTAMYSNFKGKLDVLSIPGFKTFGDLVLALDLQWVYVQIIEAKLTEACLDMSTAHQLMSASRHVGWGKLEGALGKISTNTFRLYGQPCCVSKCAEAAEAASFLGGKETQAATELSHSRFIC